MILQDEIILGWGISGLLASLVHFYDEGKMRIGDFPIVFVCMLGGPVLICGYLINKYENKILWERKIDTENDKKVGPQHNL